MQVQQRVPLTRANLPAARRSMAQATPDEVGSGPPVRSVVDVDAGGVPARLYRDRDHDVLPVVLYAHGGGWVMGSVDTHDGLCRHLAAASGWAVLSVDYRLAPEHPYPSGPDDCEDAARWLIAAAGPEFGTERLVIGGESAGAHLTAVTLLRLGEAARAFRAAQLTFGAYDLSMTPSQRRWGERNLALSTPVLQWFTAKFLPGMSLEERRAPDVSPLYADLSGLPPARFVVGTQDPLLDDTLFMEARWRAAGNETELEVVAEAPHGFVGFPLTVAERELARQREYVARAIAS